MGKLSDRDASIIMLLLVIAIIALPYVLYIKDTKLDTESIKADTVTKRERLEYLKAMDLHRQEFLDRTAELNEERDKIVASYPPDIKQENYAQWLLETELNHDVTTANLDEETRKVTWDEPSQDVWIETVAFGSNDEVVITLEDGTATAYTSIYNQSTIQYQCYYAGLKKLIAYFVDQNACQIPVCYPTFSAQYEEETGIIKGAFTISQFAIRNAEDPDRKLPDVVIRPDLDKYNLRGNLYEYGTNGIDGINGIFGPIVSEEELSDEGEKALADQNERLAPDEEPVDNGAGDAGENAGDGAAEETPAEQ